MIKTQISKGKIKIKSNPSRKEKIYMISYKLAKV